jgi:hypothetical protein
MRMELLPGNLQLLIVRLLIYQILTWLISCIISESLTDKHKL